MSTELVARLLGFDARAVADAPVAMHGRLAVLIWAGLSPIALAAAGAGYAGYLFVSSLVVAGFAALAASAVVLNFQRCLNAGSGHAWHLEPAAIDRWVPQPLTLLLLLGLGAFFAQPCLLWLSSAEMEPELSARRAAQAKEYLEPSRGPLKNELLVMTEELASIAARRGIEQARLEAAMTEAREAQNMSEAAGDGHEAEVAGREAAIRLEGLRKEAEQIERRRAELEARLVALSEQAEQRFGEDEAPGGFLLARLDVLWSHPVSASLLTLLLSLFNVLPVLLRFVFLATTREYERIRFLGHRDAVAAWWSATREAQIRLLSALVDGFTPRPLRFEDPPFNSRPLILGRERGVVVRRSLRHADLEFSGREEPR